MTTGIRYAIVVAFTVLVSTGLAWADGRSFGDLLAQAKTQAAAGHRWAPPGDNMTETVMAMMDLIPTASPAQLAELSALLDSVKADNAKTADKAGPPELPPASANAAAVASPAAPPAPSGDAVQPPVAAVVPDQHDAGATASATRDAVDDRRDRAASAGDASSGSRDAVGDSPVRVAKPHDADRRAADQVASASPVGPVPVGQPLGKALAPPPVAPMPVAPMPVAPGPAAPPVAAARAAPAVVPPVSMPPAAPATSDHQQPSAADEPRGAMLFARGLYAELRGDLSGARRYYTASAQQGDGEAARNLGRLYDPAYLRQTARGGIDPDPVLARRWYERAIQLGDRQAGTLLAAMSPR